MVTYITYMNSKGINIHLQIGKRGWLRPYLTQPEIFVWDTRIPKPLAEESQKHDKFIF